MGDVLDAVSARIKAPYFGYAVLAFVAWNWRALFLLVMTDGSPEQRLAVFDANTNFCRLYVAPVFTGFCVAASAEWVRLFFDWISRTPILKNETYRIEAEHQIATKRMEFERTRSEEEKSRALKEKVIGERFSEQEEELIERALRDRKIQEIDDEEVKNKLQEEIDNLRKERDQALRNSTQAQGTFVVSAAEMALLRSASQDGSGVITKLKNFGPGGSIQCGGVAYGSTNQQEYGRYEYALRRLIQKDLIAPIGTDDVNFSLTDRGWKIAASQD